MSDVTGALPVQFDDQGRIAEDLPCAACGYNLRTQAPGAKCPECGASVQRAIFVARLRFADPKWLRSMSYSVFWLTIGLGVVVLAPLLGLSVPPPILLMAIVVVVPPVTIALGIWQMTRRDPDHRPWRIETLRRLARGCGAAAFAIFLWVVVAGLFSPEKSRPVYGAPFWLNIELLISIVLLLLAMGLLAGLLVGALVAARIRNAWLTWSIFAIALMAGLLLIPPLLLLGEYIITDVTNLLGYIEGVLTRSGYVIPLREWIDEFCWDVRLYVVPITLWALEGLGVLLIPALLWYRRRLRDAAAMAERQAGMHPQNPTPAPVVTISR